MTGEYYEVTYTVKDDFLHIDEFCTVWADDTEDAADKVERQLEHEYPGAEITLYSVLPDRTPMH